MEPELGSLPRTRPGLDREVHGHGPAAHAVGRARREDDRVHRHRGGRLVHAHVRPRRAPPHPQGARARRHEGRDHRRAAVRVGARHPHDEPGRAPPARRTRCARTRSPHPLKGSAMQFLDDSLLPENQPPLVIQVAPYGPEFLPGDSDDIPVTMAEQVQKAVDCWNAGATVLHIHVREADGKGSKRLSMFNEMLARLREAVPKMVLQVGGSISFAPEGDGEQAKWLTDDTRHMLAELTPKPDQVTIVVNTNQMNVMELMS